MVMFVYNLSLLGLLGLAFAIGFGAGWWTAVGTAMLIVKFILFGMSDRNPIPHSYEEESNVGRGMGNFIPVMQWPSLWKWPVWHKGVRQREGVPESPDADKEASPER